MSVNNVRGLTISDIDVEDFRGAPSGDVGGGAVNIANAWDLDLGKSVLRNSGSITSAACTGTLGVGNIYNSKIHDLVISDDRAYGVKDSVYPSHVNNTDFYRLKVSVESTLCSSWNTLSFELFETDAVNTTIRDSSFNGTVSLTDTSAGAPLASGYRYNIHNNRWTISSGIEYAIELDQNSTSIHHNFFSGGLYPIANFTSQIKSGSRIHHNIFDNQTGPTAVMHVVAGMLNAAFSNNTVVLRRPSWRDGVFSLAEDGFTGSTLTIRNNLFVSTHAIGDNLGHDLDSAVIGHNAFYNIASRGVDPIAGAALPLLGGFPAAYIPVAGTPSAEVGTFADGMWTAGPG